ncbi:NADH-quinone oxidoreductase subunit J [Magnetospirillum moscoviense]|uniref:NADH-quinone oxidoreductase subunit J n=1 Tax=Magnetospirillum moscoviense TaxID=1437059 RepID=A0A178MLA1_9PROT|nr:NADH-quinone oxidoreductase subunit J [Magnetospirillum moscoviense]MBF0323496.1 NADH-quinone oxidoreductase subunit J [Alphaproteobacteria bacterium]OAN49470.1 NADH:ubiquinone oxidoreductase subunit J [Magnetospirillum moscoviense]
MIAALIFYMFAGLAVAAGVMVISARNPVHSVLFLILAFFNAAGLFLLLGAEFLAMVLVVVYVGAVAVLFLFVVMMLDINFLKLREGVAQYLPIGAVIGLVLVVELGVIFGGWAFAPDVEALIRAPAPAADQITNTEALGRLLYTDYAYLFQASGLILLVAMVGSILLTHRRRPGVRKQVIADQIARTAKNSVEIVKVPTGGGI